MKAEQFELRLDKKKLLVLVQFIEHVLRIIEFTCLK